MDFKPTAQQQAVINHEEGPLLVIAGPGTRRLQLVERITKFGIRTNWKSGGR